MTTPASVVPLDQNLRHPDHDPRSRARPGQSRRGLENYLLATMASAASLIEETARIQKQTAEALNGLAGHSGGRAAAQQVSTVEDALQRLSRVEDAIRALTSLPDGRRGRLDHHSGRRPRPPEAAAQAKWPAEPLTPREEAVLRLLRGTLSLREIAQELGVSKNTVKSQVQAIYRKLHVSGRSDAIHRGRDLGMFSSRKSRYPG